MSFDQEVAGAIRGVQQQMRVTNRIKVAERMERTRGITDGSESLWAAIYLDLGIVVNP